MWQDGCLGVHTPVRTFVGSEDSLQELGLSIYHAGGCQRLNLRLAASAFACGVVLPALVKDSLKRECLNHSVYRHKNALELLKKKLFQVIIV